MKVERVLVVEDDEELRHVLSDLFRGEGVSPLVVSSFFQAQEAVRTQSFDLVLADLILPDGSGLDLLRLVRHLSPHSLRVLMTGEARIDTAVDAVRLGLFDYLIKPILAVDLDILLRRIEVTGTTEEEMALIRGETEPAPVLEEMVWGKSAAMCEVFELVKRVGQTQATVLIQGESGTGKELVAQAIRRHSTRAHHAFVKVNCAAVPEMLLESEFFGHEKGAFTGAVERREGRFEMAHAGTLLLDEIAEIPPSLQVKLLRVLQEREFERVGGNKTIQVDVRIIASTNRDLGEEVAAGRFREDLYFRLNVVPIHLPALRERGDDIEELVAFFLAQSARQHGRTISGLTPRSWDLVRSYSWPGNARELQNVIERAVIMTEGEGLMELPDFIPPPSTPAAFRFIGPPPTLAAMEKELIAAALRFTNDNRTQCARLLGISLRTLRNRLRLYRQDGAELTTASPAPPPPGTEPSLLSPPPPPSTP